MLQKETMPQMTLPYRKNDGSILTIDELEYCQIVYTLRMTAGNVTRTSYLVGIDRRTLQRKMNRWQIDSMGNPINE